MGVALMMAGLTAASAFATNDFPHEEESAKWRGVTVYDYNGSIENALPCDAGAAGGADCSFNSTDEGRRIIFGVSATCNGTWAGDIGWEGEVSSTSGKCLLSETQTGIICQHTLTREYWVRVQSGTSYMFAHLNVAPSGLATKTPTHHPLDGTFGIPSEGIFTKATLPTAGSFFQFSFPMWSEKELLIGAGPGEGAETAACDWPGLS
jgi:hypothetical protein